MLRKSLAILALLAMGLVPIAANAENPEGQSRYDANSRPAARGGNLPPPRVIHPNPAPRPTLRAAPPRVERGAQFRGSGGREFHYDHGRRYWHGRWWVYGVGSCWRYSDYWDEYYWVCGDDD